MKEAIEKIKGVTQSVDKIAADEGGRKSLPASKDYFDALVKQQRQPDAIPADNKIAVEQTAKPTLMDEMKNASRHVDSVSKISPNELIAQSQETIDRINRVKDVLATSPNLQLKSSVQGLMNNKLTHIDENIKIALSKAGAEYPSDTGVQQAKGLINPIEQYLGYLTDSQSQLRSLGTQLKTIGDNKQDITPANMLAIQIKVGYIQQELEFFSGLLNKALESTKTLMNVQV